MDLPRITWLLCAPFFIAVIATKIARRQSAGPTTRRPPPPPVAPGVPLLGVLPALLVKGPLALIHDYYAKMGSVFTVRLFHMKVTFLVGPDVSSHFYQGLDSEISQDEVSQFTIPTFGPGVAFDVDYATRHEQFRFFGDAMKPVKLRTYVGVMVREVESYFARWGQSGKVDLKHELEHLVTLIASRCLFGPAVREKMFGEVGALLRELNDGMRLITILLPHLPIPAHRRRDAARARLGGIFFEIVRSRKSGRVTENDMLQCLIDSRYKDGRGTTETEVAGMLVSALFAGQHTSSSTGTWTGARLLTHTKHLRAAVDEQERIIARHGSWIDYDVLQEMDTLHRCIKETLRLHPPALMLLRHARQSFNVRTRDGREYEVPRGHAVASPLVIHNRLAHVYEEPDKYDPDRFGRQRAEDRAGGAFAYTAFGGGRHACVGEAFAYMQIKVIWSHLLRNFELELVSPFPETDWNVVMPGPKGKVVVIYKRRQLSTTA
ncbi:obtusifoliol 14-alpha demethylase-like [Phragmites australis]|uniref:obtusifoliol 14-alpha demethylase-like n=1 Tax=Phragmites australis TaxID=29695 RepID=UPI002D797F4C|nr:obtusifoliol 14-alpha demethylase-like [Phragmites australis]XP_062188730.1 obtusifoliol 14-alpha demethylase-like [Phragmites australis]